MPGIINNAIPKQAPVPGQPPVQGKSAARPAMSPEATRIVIAAKKIMAQPQIAQQLVAMMKAAGDPAKGIAQVVFFLMKQLFEKSKGTLPPAAIVPAAQEIIVDVMKLGATAGLFKPSKELAMQVVQVAREMFKAQFQSQPAAQPPAQPAAPAAPQPAAPAPAATPAAPPMGV